MGGFMLTKPPIAYDLFRWHPNFLSTYRGLTHVKHCVLNVKALVCAFRDCEILANLRLKLYPGVLAAVQDPVGATDLADGEYCQVAAGVKLLLVTVFLSPLQLEPLHGVDDWSCVDLDKWSILLEVIQQETGTPELG